MQLKLDVITIPIEDYTIIIGIFTIYGIFLAFLQFSVGFAIQNKRDKVWGKSIVKHFIQQHVPLSILKSRTFIVMFVYIAVFPFITDSLFVNNRATESLLSAIWETSVFTVFMFYIFLFVRTIRVIEKFFDIQESDNKLIKYFLKENVKRQYHHIFLRFFPKRTDYFLNALSDSLQKLSEVEKNEMFLGVYHHVLTELQLNSKRNPYTSNDMIELFARVFIYIKDEQIHLTTKELLTICKKHQQLILAVMSSEIREEANLLPNTYVEKRLHFPDVIWKSIQSIDDLDQIYHYITKRHLNNLDDAEDHKLERSMQQSFWKLLDHYKIYQKEIPNNHPLFIRNKYQLYRPIETKVQEYIFSYILRLEHNEHTTKYMKRLTNLLDTKYCVAIIFYYVLYPAHIEWKKETVLFKEIMQKHDFQTFDEDIVHFVVQSITHSNISHRITERLLKIVMEQLNTFNFENDFLQFCLDQRYFSLARFVKLKYIFSHSHFSQLVNFSSIELNQIDTRLHESWQMDFLNAFLDEPELLKKQSIQTTLFYFFEEILHSNYPDIAFVADDFRIFYINHTFKFREEQFEQLMNGKIPAGKGIINYLILQSVSLEYLKNDPEKFTYLKRQVNLLLDKNNKTLESYVQGLADQAIECGYHISIIKQTNIIDAFKQNKTYANSKKVKLF